MFHTIRPEKLKLEPERAEQKSSKTSENLLLDTLPPRVDPKSGMNEDSVAVTLLSRQDTTTARLDEWGDLIIEQICWPNENQIVLIGASCIEQFVDGLLDLLGVPSVGRPTP
ncbi:hypothetical protein [Bradyrhizobium sp. USDA 4449]